MGWSPDGRPLRLASAAAAREHKDEGQNGHADDGCDGDERNLHIEKPPEEE